MNLHGLASGLVSAINPFVQATVKRSMGSTTGADGNRTPTYTPFDTISVQVQPLGMTDIQKMDGLNIQGVRRAIYVSADVEAMLRVDKRGGDVIVFPPGVMPEGGTWIAALVLEAWPGWRKIAILLQNSA